jgi:hypothetical protein
MVVALLLLCLLVGGGCLVPTEAPQWLAVVGLSLTTLPWELRHHTDRRECDHEAVVSVAAIDRCTVVEQQGSRYRTPPQEAKSHSSILFL